MRLGVSFSHADLGNDPGFLRSSRRRWRVPVSTPARGRACRRGHPDRAGGEKVHTYEVPYHEPFVLFGFLGAVTTTLELVTSIPDPAAQRQTVLRRQAKPPARLC